MALAGGASATLAASDPATGFGISPPEPFHAEASPAQADDLAFSVRSRTGEPPAAATGALCRAGLKMIHPGAPRASQDALNARVDDEGFREAIRKPLSPRYVIHKEQVFELAGARGIEFVTTPRSGPNASEVRVSLSFIEVPAGRLSFVCATSAAAFEAARETFHTIRSTLQLPK